MGLAADTIVCLVQYLHDEGAPRLSRALAVQEDVRQMLTEADPSSRCSDIKGMPLSVLTLLRRSFDHLPTENHK
jgi:hypothetical protein